ncbi:hypothetical protein GCM10011581_37280 [Saccharopolyspora subtropica]|uniref:Asp23/Gls24 family envelope stress response protein n=1 Tax=Saccharopolyspora thermophila TaxID=89367 RepID=A0A917K3R2_9PSEU|nr:hypothetical protein [Saccharopolyspora subtropica]GGI96656.1 hypothetical protein GCM10011581_37280 [Saccharopolyspora subtropica]
MPEHVSASELADRVRAHPSVVRLHGGPFGAIASYLPGRKVVGVRLPDEGEPVEVGVVLRLDRPLPDVVAELRGLVAAVVGPVPVDIVVGDVVTPDEPPEGG